jgi:hypothetical protein
MDKKQQQQQKQGIKLDFSYRPPFVAPIKISYSSRPRYQVAFRAKDQKLLQQAAQEKKKARLDVVMILFF